MFGCGIGYGFAGGMVIMDDYLDLQ